MSFDLKEGVKAFFVGFVGFYVFFLAMGLVSSLAMWDFEILTILFKNMFKSVLIARLSLICGIVAFLVHGFFWKEIRDAKGRKEE